MKLFIPLLIAFFFAGCSTMAPTMNEYTLHFPPSQQTSAVATNPKTLQVTHPKALPSLNLKEIQYQHPSGEVNGYLYSRWSDTPAYMIERSLSLSLNEHHLFRSILASTSTAKADYLLESNLLAFYQRLYENPHSDVIIDIMCHLIDPNTKQIIASKRFSISKPSKSYDAKGGVEAFNEAMEELNRQNILWISSVMKGLTN